MFRAGMTSSGLSSRSLLLFGAFAATFAAITSAPASLLPALAGFDKTGVRYEQARGSLWSGTLTNVETRGVRLGEAAYQLAPLSLLTGAADLRFRLQGGDLAGSGRARFGFLGEATLSEAKLIFDLGAARRYGLMGEPLTGMLRAEVVEIALTRDGCVSAQARFMTDVLAGPASKLGARGFDLAGAGSCEGGDFIADLWGDGDDGAVSLRIRVRPDMTYAFEASAAPAREEVEMALRALGFEEKDGELTIGAEGTIRSIGS